MNIYISSSESFPSLTPFFLVFVYFLFFSIWHQKNVLKKQEHTNVSLSGLFTGLGLLVVLQVLELFFKVSLDITRPALMIFTIGALLSFSPPKKELSVEHATKKARFRFVYYSIFTSILFFIIGSPVMKTMSILVTSACLLGIFAGLIQWGALFDRKK